MIEYQTTATLYYATSIRPELGLEKEIRVFIKQYIEQEGLDAFLDTLEYGDITSREVSDEEAKEMFEDGQLLIPVEALRETLTAVSLGLLEIEGLSKEQALEDLKKFPEKE
jgi:hypothetical protein